MKTFDTRSEMKRALRIALATALLLAPALATATTYYVDGACPTSGAGTSRDCGASGPFRTIMEAVSAAGRGDATTGPHTINVRGPHAGSASHGHGAAFDGRYNEYLGFWGAKNVPAPGFCSAASSLKTCTTASDCANQGNSCNHGFYTNLLCTPANPCVVQGCSASDCGTDETAIVSGLVNRTDWTETSPGSGIWTRSMEARSEPLDTYHLDDDFSPGQLLEGTGDPLTQMPYSTNASPPEGRWNYDLVRRVVAVNPTGTGNPNSDPATKIWVPDKRALLLSDGLGGGIACPDTGHCHGLNNVTLRRLRFEGPRHTIWEMDHNPGDFAALTAGQNLTFDTITMRYAPSYAFIGTRFRNLTIKNLDVQYIGRGLQSQGGGGSAAQTWGNAWGFRLFLMDHAVIQNTSVKHVGTAFNGCWNGGCKALDCQWCDAPWNVNANQPMGGNGMPFDLKQSAFVTMRNVTIEDASGFLQNDVTHDAEYDGLDVRRARAGWVNREFTCFTGTTRNFNVQVHDSRFDECGFNQELGGIISFDFSPINAGEYGLKLYNNMITRPSYAGISVGEGGSCSGSNQTDKVFIWNNTITGVKTSISNPPDGIRAVGLNTNLDIQNNLIANTVGPQTANICIDPATASKNPTIDYNLFNQALGARQCVVRWNGTCGSEPSVGGNCFTTRASFSGSTGKETHGLDDSDTGGSNPVLTDTRSSPPNVHIQATSKAVHNGADLSAFFSTDFDGDSRPRGARTWDIGADQFGTTSQRPTAPVLVDLKPVGGP